MYAGYIENGRRYQTKREGEYWGPSDEKQFESMQAAHLLCTILDSQRANPLFRSPIRDNPQNILDVGTGNGIWAIEVADRYPSAVVRGVDLYPPPETWIPPNCKLEVDDMLKPWMLKEEGKFDLIHLRLLVGAFAPQQWTGVYKQAYEYVCPSCPPSLYFPNFLPGILLPAAGSSNSNLTLKRAATTALWISPPPGPAGTKSSAARLQQQENPATNSIT